MNHIVFRALPIAPSKEPEGQQLGFHTVHRQKVTMFSKMLWTVFPMCEIPQSV